jgi:hypothetical protein
MPMTSPLGLSVTPPPGSGLCATTINAGTVATNAAVTATLAGAPYHQTSTALSSAPNPSSYGQSVTFTATVSPADGGGTVSFTADGKPVTGCSSQALTRANGNYEATCTTSSMTAGNHAIDGAYSGDTNYSASSGTATQRVRQGPSATALSSRPASSSYGQAVTFTAIVSPADGAGTVTFGDAGHTIPGCTREPLRNHAGTYRATCTTSSLPRGTDKITAVYNGDKDHSGSTGTLNQVVTGCPRRPSCPR